MDIDGNLAGFVTADSSFTHSYFIFEMVGGKTGDALSEITTLVLSTQCCWLHWESERSVESEAGKNTIY